MSLNWSYQLVFPYELLGLLCSDLRRREVNERRYVLGMPPRRMAGRAMRAINDMVAVVDCGAVFAVVVGEVQINLVQVRWTNSLA